MDIIGYTSATSVKPGHIIGLHLGLTRTLTTPRHVPMVIENVTDRSVSARLEVTVEPQPVPRDAPWEGYDWPATVAFSVPRSWPSGLYRLIYQAEGETQNVLSFVVRPTVPGRTAKTLFNLSYLTPLAYSRGAGAEPDDQGHSFYVPVNEDAGVARARSVSFDRPSLYFRIANGDTFIREARLLGWLRENDYEVECCSGVDLHSDPDVLSAYDCLVIAYHDEYWTKAMRDTCEAFVRNGGNIICLSGNTCFRQIRLEDNNRTAVFYKYAHLDPHRHRNLDEVTVAWADPPVNRPQNHLLGVGFTHGAFRGTSTVRKPYDIRFPDHWVFEGVDSDQTSAFIGYEADAAEYVDEDEGYPRVTGTDGTPRSTTVLATADLREWTGKPGRATMVIYGRNGTVFNAASTEWIEVIDTDPVVAKITQNVFARLTRPVPWDWEVVGRTPEPTAMTALDGMLFLSSTDNDLLRRFPVGAAVPWKKIGHANVVKAMASIDGRLFCVTPDNSLWTRPPSQVDTDWRRIGTGPVEGVRALAGAGGMLYVIDNEGTLQRRPASTNASATFEKMTRFEQNRDIVALTAYGDILIASTSTDRLLRSNRDFVGESTKWHDIHHCNFSVGLAVMDWMLYVVTSEQVLWRIDLSGLQQP